MVDFIYITKQFLNIQEMHTDILFIMQTRIDLIIVLVKKNYMEVNNMEDKLEELTGELSYELDYELIDHILCLDSYEEAIHYTKDLYKDLTDKANKLEKILKKFKAL